MELEIIYICALCALIELDFLYAGQFMISRPVIAGSIIGAVCGSFAMGFFLGLWTEFVFIRCKPVGTHIAPNEFACISSSIILTLCYNLPFHISFLFGLLAAVIFSKLDTEFRKFSAGFNENIAMAIRKNAKNLGRWVIKMVFFRFCAVFVFFVLFAVILGNLTAPIKNIPSYADIILLAIFVSMPVIAFLRFMIICGKTIWTKSCS
jgi:mannose/fructose/N-acetylgalactosamine-specific phosphotransferase system component IIC